ncbi:MAG: SurA N-terminal domain-containing protein [Bacteroidales bacterium]|nr:SurA N-terminal domain-containing protein [Bacteroidales bacterium]
MAIIGNLRKHSWIIVAFVAIAIAAFTAGSDVPKFFQSTFGRNANAFATIGGDVVNVEEFNARVSERENIMKMYGYTDYSIKEAVWQEMLQDKLLGKEIDALGIAVSDLEMNDMYYGRFISPLVQQQLGDPQTGEYNKEYVRNLISQIALQPDTTEFYKQWLSLEQDARKDRERSKYLTMVYSGIYMPKALANTIADIDSRKADVRVAGMLYSQAQDEAMVLTDEDFENYFKAHQKEINAQFFRGDLNEYREMTYAVFTATPSLGDMETLNKEVASMWEQMKDLEGDDLKDFVNVYGIFDSTYVKSEDIMAPLDSVVRGSHAGKLIDPQVVPCVMKNEPVRYAYGEYVMGKVIGTAMRPDSVRISMIFLPSEKYSQGITTTLAEAKDQRDSAMRDLKMGMSFEDAVRKYSIDTTNLGDQEWLLDGTPVMFMDEIMKTKVNDVFTYDIPDDRGFFIVKVTDKTAPRMKYSLALVTKPITPSSETDRAIRDKANLFASKYSTVEAMREGAAQENVQLRQCAVIPMSDSLTGYTNTHEAVRWAFNKDTKQGAVSGQVFTSDYNYLVVGLDNIYKPGKLTLDQVRQAIEPLVRMEKLGNQLAEQYADAGNNIDAVAAKMGTTVDTITDFSFRSYYMGRFGMEPKCAGAVAAKKSGMVGPVKGASGIYFISVDNTRSDAATDPQGISNELEQRCQNDVQRLPLLLQKRTKIVDNRSLYF